MINRRGETSGALWPFKRAPVEIRFSAKNEADAERDLLRLRTKLP